jgi:hypothetical protein
MGVCGCGCVYVTTINTYLFPHSFLGTLLGTLPGTLLGTLPGHFHFQNPPPHTQGGTLGTLYYLVTSV